MSNTHTIKSAGPRSPLQPHVGRASARELEHVFGLRYQVYVEEMGRRQQWAQSHQVQEPLDSTGVILAARLGNEVVGTCRVNFTAWSDVSEFDFHHIQAFDSIFPGRVGLATKMIVRKEHRGSQLFLALAKQVIRECLTADCQALLIDCNQHLVDAFGKMGFVSFKSLVHPDYGNVSLMILFFHDLEHLRRINSPFLTVIEKEKTNERYI